MFVCMFACVVGRVTEEDLAEGWMQREREAAVAANAFNAPPPGGRSAEPVVRCIVVRADN